MRIKIKHINILKVLSSAQALNEIDEAIRSDEPAGEKLKKLVEEHSEACDEIKEELAGHKEGTMPQSSPLSE